MTNLYKEKLFFFNDDCSELKITPNSIEHAYLAILDDDLNTAEKIFSGIDSPRAIWGKRLVNILNGYLQDFPTFFEIRNFLEIDLDFLLKNQKIGYVEQFLGSLEYLATINMETYKFVGRVMYENKLKSAALKYFEQAKEIYYNDPELHFLLSKYFLDINNFENAMFYINECLKLLPDYYPALLQKEKIEQMIN